MSQARLHPEADNSSTPVTTPTGAVGKPWTVESILQQAAGTGTAPLLVLGAQYRVGCIRDDDILPAKREVP